MDAKHARFPSLCLMLLVVWMYQPPGAFCEDLYLGSSAYAPGAGGSVWTHEVDIFNPHDTGQAIRIYWLPDGQDSFVDLVVEPSRTTRFDNILDSVFGLPSGSIGGLRVVPASDRLQFHSRIVNENGGAKFGQVIPAIPESMGFVEGEEAFIHHVTEDDDYRTNLTFVNTTESALGVNYELFAADGTLLTTDVRFLPPWDSVQLNRIFQAHSPVMGYLRVWTDTSGGRGICYGNVVSNFTNDSRYQPAVKPTGLASEQYVPIVANSAGVTSDLSLFSPSTNLTATVDLLATGSDNTTPLSVDVPVLAGQDVRIPDVLATLFSHSGTGALRVSTSGGELMVSSQTSNGSMIRFVAPDPGANQMPYGESVALIHLTENLGVRTDVGAVNTSGVEIDLAVDLYGEIGESLGTLPMHLLPFSHSQLDSVFSSVGHPDVASGFAIVRTTTPGGTFMSYATVTDLNTLDSYHVASQQSLNGLFTDGFESGDTSAWSHSVP